MSKINHIKLLENLSNQKKINKNFNRQFRLEKQGFIEQSKELFKPIIEQQEKTNKNILKAIEQNPQNQVPAIEQPNRVFPPIKKLDRNNSYFQFMEKAEDDFNLFKLGTRNESPQLKANSEEIIVIPNKPEKEIINLKNSIGLNKLLFKKNFTNNDSYDITNDDLKNYFALYDYLGEDEGTSERAKAIRALRDYRRDHPEEYSGNGIVTISENPEELFKRLEILLAAKSQGHNNSKDEISAILDELLKQNHIDKAQYLSIYKP